MSRRQRRNKNVINRYMIVIFIVFLITVATGYSILSDNLKIEGKSNINFSAELEGYDVVVTLIHSWGSSPDLYYQYKIELTNNSEETLEGWTISVGVPDDTVIANNANNANTELKDGVIEFTNLEYNKNVEPGKSVNFEFQIKTSVVNLNIDSAILNNTSSGNTQIPATGIEIKPIEMIIHVDETSKISASLIPQNAVGTINWESSNEEVVVVDNKGNVTAISEGNAIITATINGASKQCNVEVLSKVIQEVLTIDIKEANSWSVGDLYYTQYNITLKNISNSKTSSWEFDLQLPEGAKIESYNSGVVELGNDTYTLVCADYNASIAVGADAIIQIQVTSPIEEYSLTATNIIVR